MAEYLLRPEAGPVPYEKLQRRAKEALKSIVDALRAAVDSANKAASDSGNASSASAIDRNRASRLFFVSGEPGSGKSTLYVTLRAMLSKHEKDQEYSKGYEKEPKLKGQIDGLRGVVRWLEPIDLEVVGDKEENLLAAVLVRLIRELAGSSSGYSGACDGAIKKLEELAADIGMAWESNLPARAGELDPDSYSMEVMRAQQARLGVNKRLREALDELAKNSCYGCTDSTLFVLPVDDLYLKPDASLQLLRLLRMISVPRLFFLIMGDITTVEALFTEKALADWTRVAGAEIFQILPDRLNDALARARELRARFLRKLLPPGQRTEIQPMDWYEAMKFKPELRNGGAESLGTWLAQVELDRPWTHTGEATLTAAQPADEHTSTTSENNHQGNLFDFLTCRPLTYLPPLDVRNVVEEVSGLKGEKRKSHEAYTGLQILDATPREAMDLWRALGGLIKEQEEEKKKRAENQDGNMAQMSSHDSKQDRSDYKIPLLSRVLEFVMLTVDEQNFLNEEEQDVILYRVLPTRRYYDPATYLNMALLRLEPALGDWKAVYEVAEDEVCKVWVHKHRPWKLKVKSSDEKEEKARAVSLKLSAEGRQLNATAEYQGEGTGKHSEDGTIQTSGELNMLPPRPTAWLVLLHDLASMWRPASINKTLVENLNEELKDKQSKHDAFKAKEAKPPNEFPGWAALLEGSTYKSLPLPKFKTVRDLDCFLRVWNRGLEVQFPELENPEKPGKGEDKASLLIQLLWAFAGWTVIEKQYYYFAQQDKKWFDEGLRADSEQESALGNPPMPQAETGGWKQKIREFRENSLIKKCLAELSKINKREEPKVEDGTSSMSSSSQLNFDEWAEGMLKEVCPDLGSEDDNHSGEESVPTVEDDKTLNEQANAQQTPQYPPRETEEDKH